MGNDELVQETFAVREESEGTKEEWWVTATAAPAGQCVAARQQCVPLN